MKGKDKQGIIFLIDMFFNIVIVFTIFWQIICPIKLIGPLCIKNRLYVIFTWKADFENKAIDQWKMFCLSILCNPSTQNKLSTCKKKYVANAFWGIFYKKQSYIKIFRIFRKSLPSFFVYLNLNPPFSDITWCSIWTHVSTCTVFSRSKWAH